MFLKIFSSDLLIFGEGILMLLLTREGNKNKNKQPQNKDRRTNMAKTTELTDKQKLAAYEKMIEDRRRHTERRLAKINVIVRKAEAAGITATEAEIDEEIKRPKKGSK